MDEQAPYLYLTTTGRVTGKPREIEIWFVEAEGKFYILAKQKYNTQWVKNVRAMRTCTCASVRALSTQLPKCWMRRRTRRRGRTAQQLMRDKYDWGEGLLVEIAPYPTC